MKHAVLKYGALQRLAVGAALLSACPTAWAGRAELGGYLRVAARPDFQGGAGSLGYWNLYGRLLNESSYAALELKYDVLERQAASSDPYTSLHFKLEGGSIANAGMGGGSLAGFRMSQLYARAGNVLLPGVVWQVGTLDTYFGDLGLYDMRPAQIFFDTVGLSGRVQRERFDLLLGFGDSGWGMKGADYNAILTPGGTLRVRVLDGLELGVGGVYRYEPMVAGNSNSPYVTPDVDYEAFLRNEVAQRYLQENPNREREFPDPVATDASSWKAIGYLGFGGFGPVRWNNTFASVERLHPESSYQESYRGQDYTIYTTNLTDERTRLLVGNELQLGVVPGRFDVAWGALYGLHWDDDNSLAPSDHDRWYASTVLRGQLYMSETVHLLLEGSVAREHSTNGNAWREHSDSIFENTEGVPNSEGLERGDTDTRNTVQGKGGVVLSPLGAGLYVRPSLRLLYGVQYSNQNNAFGNSFVESLDQFNEFGNVERHWHHVVSMEAEAWF